MLKDKFPGYKVAFGCFLIMFIHLGVLGSIGVFIPSIAKELSIPMSSISLVVTFATSSAFICSLFATQFIAKVTAKRAMYFATVVCAFHYVIFGFTQNVWFIYLGGTLAGAVMGFGTNVAAASVIAEWFIDRRSTVVGLVFGGAGFGSSVAMFFSGILIENFGWRSAYFILATVILVFGILANFLFIKSPQELNEKPLGWEKQLDNENNKQATVGGVSFAEARKSSTFYMWWTAILLIAMLITGYTSFAPTFWQEAGMTHLQSSNYISLLSLMGAISVMVSGALAEKFGVKFFVLYNTVAFTAGTVLLVMFPNSGTVITLITIVLVAVAYPSSNSLPATITASGFGNLEYGKIMAQLSTAGYLGKALLPIILGQVHKITGSLSLGFVILSVFSIIGLLLFLTGYKLAPYKETNSLSS